jgi:DNA topoisomerase IB
LAIPPAWKDIWISPDPDGHIQATGVDDAGRKQYIYHPNWTRRRGRRKFAHVRIVGDALPRLRRRVGKDLNSRGVTRARVLALAVRLLDLGLFRIGSDAYATGADPTFGVATLLARHVSQHGSELDFDYQSKGNTKRTVTVADRAAARAIAALKRQRTGTDRLLAWRDKKGAWHEIHSDDINDYLRSASGISMSAKDLRTWHATVRAAARLSQAGPPTSKTAARRTAARVFREVADDLGNTPAVARASYVDPVVIERFEHGKTINVPARKSGPAVEVAVAEFLHE